MAKLKIGALPNDTVFVVEPPHPPSGIKHTPVASAAAIVKLRLIACMVFALRRPPPRRPSCTPLAARAPREQDRGRRAADGHRLKRLLATANLLAQPTHAQAGRIPMSATGRISGCTQGFPSADFSILHSGAGARA